MKKFAEIVFLVVPLEGASYGMAAHELYGLGFAMCGLIGGVLGVIAAALFVLVTAVVVSVLCSGRRFEPKK